MKTSPVILVVDDDRGLLRLVNKVLHREALSTVAFDSGLEALAWLNGNHADLLLVDLQLPDISGREIIQQIASRSAPVPFIVITGQGDERVAVTMMKEGALDYLVKDTQFLDLLPEVVQRALTRIETNRRLIAAECALRKEYAFSSAVLNTAGAMVIVLDREGGIIRLNRECETITGFSLDEVEGRRFARVFFAPDDEDRVQSELQSIAKGEKAAGLPSTIVTRGGEKRVIEWSNAVLRTEDSGVDYVIATGIDVTDRKRLEQEIIKISELEKRRIGQDLHDGLCQHLAGTELMSQVLERNLDKRGFAEARQAERIGAHVREAIAQTRGLARGLSPVHLETNGLMCALQELAVNTENLFSVRCCFESKGTVLVQNNETATHLYRIAQEAITNAIKHGKAETIQVLLEDSGSKAQLSITDDGCGFAAQEPAQRGMGLRIMKYRVGVIGGTLDIRPAPAGTGVRVCCEFRKDFVA